ncbi:TBC domain protein [Penicillium brasilianum]|uniref:TBC domain protein n=1 Tax=Penicillium brasilianum TaxID=104259 RepID=A0A1S9RMJ4_PENBI|nr:TBC domain protein [Penicillium brasilianum]
MRDIEETRKRWETLFLGHDTSSDLRAALRAEQGAQLCTDGLRSICWKVFLLFDSVEREQWSQKLAESRDAYSALRAHFLKYIEHPDDLESTVDPLADDEESPWQTLRNDEKLRAEIVQDVDRCLQENFFFQEPSTKRKLTDVLFVYSKLNPDVGYRQGMHELLAPILWVIDRDSVESPTQGATEKEDSLMLDLLDTRFVEHDSFTLFLSVMQTARIYYEHGETKSANGQVDVIPIVNRCQYLHQEALTIIDHELADHLHAVEVLPQIFLTRWMRLLFGREFPFDDVLEMWDLLFAHGLRSDLVDFTCIAMLLRIRWQLLKADYSGALSMLLRYPPPEPHSPQAFVHDALYLEQNPTAERGSFLISKYSGRPPESSKPRSRSGIRPAMKAQLWEDFKGRSESSSPGSSPARNSPKSLEALFQDVSQGIQRRTESWGVAKAVRGAVTEARKNMQTMHYEPALRSAATRPKPVSTMAVKGAPHRPTPTELGLQTKIDRLEERNQQLANTLSEALKDLRMQLGMMKNMDADTTDTVKHALDRAQSVQDCLEDSMLPPPVGSASHSATVDEATPQSESLVSKRVNDTETPEVAEKPDQQGAQPPSLADTSGPSLHSGTPKAASIATTSAMTTAGHTDAGLRAAVRPSLSDAGFSWMLGGNRNLSTFVSPASVPPEQTRHQDQPRSKGSSPLFSGHGDEHPRTDQAEHDELALHSLSGARGPL